MHNELQDLLKIVLMYMLRNKIVNVTHIFKNFQVKWSYLYLKKLCAIFKGKINHSSNTLPSFESILMIRAYILEILVITH